MQLIANKVNDYYEYRLLVPDKELRELSAEEHEIVNEFAASPRFSHKILGLYELVRAIERRKMAEGLKPKGSGVLTDKGAGR